MHVEGVAIIPRCAECEAHWLAADTERWQAWFTDDEPGAWVADAFDAKNEAFGHGVGTADSG
jgi:hypothetical protein